MANNKTITLHHWNSKAIRINLNRTYRDEPFWNKPDGLWLSDESDTGWKPWCDSERWNLDGFKHLHLIECDISKWLIINTPNKLTRFTKKYLSTSDFGLPYIDWQAVKAKYAGIIISPYQWEHRHNPKTSWYYGWDCASACVWDLSTIISVKKQVLPRKNKKKHLVTA
jgi:hypothetical protein